MEANRPGHRSRPAASGPRPVGQLAALGLLEAIRGQVAPQARTCTTSGATELTPTNPGGPMSTMLILAALAAAVALLHPGDRDD